MTERTHRKNERREDEQKDRERRQTKEVFYMEETT